MSTIVIVGAGASGFYTAYTLRNLGFAGKITLLSRENVRPYERPVLSSQLLTGSELETLEPALDDLNVVWRPGVSATGLTTEHELELSDGSREEFDFLVIATGASPRTLVPGGIAGLGDTDSAELPPVVALNDYADVERISGTPLAGRVGVIGGSWLGTELVSAFDLRRPETELIWYTRQPPLSGRLPDEVHRRVAPWFAHIDRRDAHALATPGGAPDSIFDVDLVLAAVGVAPNTDWLRGSILVDYVDDLGYLHVDARSRVGGFEHIVALGDVTGTTRHWQPALQQAELVAATILDPATPVDLNAVVPYAYTNIWENDLTVIGTVSGPGTTHFAERGGSDQWVAFHTTPSGMLLGVITCNSPRDIARARRVFRSGQDYPIAEASLSTAPGKW